MLDVACDYFAKVSKVTGRHYAPFVYLGAKDATKVIVAMGSVTETIREVVADLNKKAKKLALLKCTYIVRLVPNI